MCVGLRQTQLCSFTYETLLINLTATQQKQIDTAQNSVTVISLCNKNLGSFY